MPPSSDYAANHKPVVILGAGGHARVLISLLRLINRPIAALLDDNPNKHNTTLDGITITASLDATDQHHPNQIELVNALGSAHRPTARQTLYEHHTQRGYTFATLLHPAAIIAPETTIQTGAQVMAAATLQPGVTLHPNTLINTHATLDHDTTIGQHTHIAPGTTICGNVTIGQTCHIGANATIIQNITLGHHVVVGAGSTVLTNAHNNQTLVGSPAKPI